MQIQIEFRPFRLCSSSLSPFAVEASQSHSIFLRTISFFSRSLLVSLPASRGREAKAKGTFNWESWEVVQIPI